MRAWFIDQMAMYAAYHRDKRNKITHFIGVPMIVFSVMIISWGVDLFMLGGEVVNLAVLLSAVLLLLYILISPMVGLLLLIDFSILLWLAMMVSTMGGDVPFYSFLALFIIGWIIQFWGHVFEGRKPALFDNLVQIFMAPFFLACEAVWAAGLQKGLEEEIEAQTHKFEA